MHSMRISCRFTDQLRYKPSSAIKLISELLMIIVVLLTFNTSYVIWQIVNVTALPITSKPIEITAENLAWQAWLMLPLEQKNQIKSRKVTPKSIFLLPLREDCPPDHHKVNFKCIPIASGTNAMLIDPTVLGLLLGDTNSTFDYDYDDNNDDDNDDKDHLTVNTVNILKDDNETSTNRPTRQDEPLKFHLFQSRYPTNYEDINDDYSSLPSSIPTVLPTEPTEPTELTEPTSEPVILTIPTELSNNNKNSLIKGNDSTTFVEINTIFSKSNDSQVSHKTTIPYSMNCTDSIGSIGHLKNEKHSKDSIVSSINLADILRKDENTATISPEVANGGGVDQYDKTTTMSSIIESDLFESRASTLKSILLKLYVTNTFTDPPSTPATALAPSTALASAPAVQYKIPDSSENLYKITEAQSDELISTTATATATTMAMAMATMSASMRTTTPTTTAQVETVEKETEVLTLPAIASSSTDRIVKNDHDQFRPNTYDNKQDFRFALSAIESLITTLERNYEYRATTIKSTDAIITSKNDTESELKRIPAPWRKMSGDDDDGGGGGGRFKQKPLRYTELVKEWHLINKLATESWMNIENAEYTENIQNTENIQLKAHAVDSKIQEPEKRFTYSPTLERNNFTINDENVGRPLNMNSKRVISSSPTQPMVIPASPITPQSDVENDSDKENTSKAPIEYPIEPLLLKLWSAYNSSFRKRNT